MNVLIPVLALILPIASSQLAQQQVQPLCPGVKKQPCNSLKEKTEPDEETLKALEAHKLWLGDFTKGERARLTDLENVRLTPSKLGWADLGRVKACGVNLSQTDLSNANLMCGDLRSSYLRDSVLKNAVLVSVDFRGAEFLRTDLTGANLQWSKLNGARFDQSDLTSADLRGADLTGAFFEPAKLPDMRSIAEARGLATLEYDHPIALVQLREALKKAGLRQQEREVTYAINRVRRLDGFESFTRFLLFELTCQWGLRPFQPLKLLLGFFIGFTILYSLALRWSKSGRIVREVQEGATSAPQEAPTDKSSFLTPFFFSLQSTFYFGWEELRFDHWIARFNPKSYRLKAHGWFRPVSATQSLLSLYLLVLFFLAYFGRPFE